MASLSQALRLGDLPPPHRTFQGHATHIIEWSMMLRPNDSWSTCILQGIATFLHYASRRSAAYRYTTQVCVNPLQGEHVSGALSASLCEQGYTFQTLRAVSCPSLGRQPCQRLACAVRPSLPSQPVAHRLVNMPEAWRCEKPPRGHFPLCLCLWPSSLEHVATLLQTAIN